MTNRQRQALGRARQRLDLPTKICEARGQLSAAQLSRRCHYTVSAAYHWESGACDPSVEALLRVAIATGRELVIEFREPEAS